MDKNKKIKRLIDDARYYEEFSWLSEIQLEMTDVSVEIPTESAKDIYSVRAKISEYKGSNIEGFEALLKNLESAKSESVFIQRMEAKDGFTYHIFADSGIDEILGVLKVPAKIEKFE